MKNITFPRGGREIAQMGHENSILALQIPHNQGYFTLPGLQKLARERKLTACLNILETLEFQGDGAILMLIAAQRLGGAR